MKYILVLLLLGGCVRAGDCKPNKYEGVFKKASERVAENMANKDKLMDWYSQFLLEKLTLDEFLDLTSAMHDRRMMSRHDDFEKVLDEVERKTIVTFPPGKCIYLVPLPCTKENLTTCYRFEECPMEVKDGK